MGVFVLHLGSAGTALGAQAVGDFLTKFPLRVQFFLALAGFLTAYTFRPEESGLKSFLRRLLRLYPCYLLLIALIVIGKGATGRLTTGDIQDALLSLLFLQTWVPGHSWGISFVTWTLPVIVLGYAVASLIMRWVMDLPLKALLGLIVCVIVFHAVSNIVIGNWIVATKPFGESSATYWNLLPPNRMASFLCGLVAFRFYADGTFGKNAKFYFALFVGLVATGMLLNEWLQNANVNTIDPNMGVRVFAGLGCAMLVVALAFARGRVGAMLGHPMLVALGSLSYPLYLFHAPIIGRVHLLFDHFGTQASVWMLGVVSLPLSLAVAWAVHRWVEVPARRWTTALVNRIKDPTRGPEERKAKTEPAELRY